VNFQATQPGKIADTLHDIAVQTRRKGIVIVISDLLEDEESVLQAIQHLRFCKHEVILFHLLDPYEVDFPMNGLIEFIGLEQVPKIMAPAHEIRKSYMEALQTFLTRIREGCERNNCHYHLVKTSEPLQEVLTNYLSFRQKTMVR
jgi:hypothetical protein